MRNITQFLHIIIINSNKIYFLQNYKVPDVNWTTTAGL